MTGTVLAQLWEGLKATGPMEWIANVTGVAYALLVMWHKRIGWVFGGISSSILAVLFWRVDLPMQALLQVSYVVAAVYGWWSWSRPRRAAPISMWHWRGHLAVMAGCVLASLLLGAPAGARNRHFRFIDSLVFCAGMFATWLLARVPGELGLLDPHRHGFHLPVLPAGPVLGGAAVRAVSGHCRGWPGRAGGRPGASAA